MSFKIDWPKLHETLDEAIKTSSKRSSMSREEFMKEFLQEPKMVPTVSKQENRFDANDTYKAGKKAHLIIIDDIR